MSKIIFQPSIVLDMICYFEKSSLSDTQWMNQNQIKIIRKINRMLGKDFNHECLGMSTLSLILSIYADNSTLAYMTFDDLITIFYDSKHLIQKVKSVEMSEYTRSYVYPMLDWLENGYSEKYVEKLQRLKDIGFEEIYNNEILPIIKEEASRYQDETDCYQSEKLVYMISKMKQREINNDIHIFVSFFSAPTAFTLYNGSYLTCFISGKVYGRFMQLSAHELMHGFASNELIGLYQKYTQSNPYLIKCHQKLIDEYKSGDEEEMVMAAEYYLVQSLGLVTHKEMIKYAKNMYGSCCPVSVLIFDLLSHEKEIPTPYNEYLIKAFSSDCLPKDNIQTIVDSL